MNPEAPPNTEISDTRASYAPSLLLPYVPPLVAAGPADGGRRDPWSRRLAGTLLVADVSGFTRLSDAVADQGRAGAEHLIGVLNTYYGRVLREVKRHGGSPFRFGGDSLVVFFGGDDHALLAVACARAIHASLARSRRLPAASGGGRLLVSAGVHSGSFLLVNGGSRTTGYHYMLLGADVAAAVHAQDRAPSGETCLTESNALQLGGRAALLPFEPGLCLLAPAAPDEPALAHRRRVQPAPAPPSLEGYLEQNVVARIAARGPDEADGEHRRVTVLFLKLDGLHRLAEHPPAIAEAAVDRCVRAIARVVRERGGLLVGFDPTETGQQALIAFGLSRETEDDEARAALTALALRRALAALPEGVGWRIGLNSGVVFAGDLGAAWRRDYTVLGDAVNVAARLAAGSAPGQIVAEAGLAGRLSALVRTRPLPPLVAKGKPRPLPRLALAGRAAPLRRARSEQVLLDREREQAALQRVVSAAWSGTARLLLLSGAAGMGKSALLHAAVVDWERRGGRAVEGSARGLGGRPLEAWVACLRDLVGLRRGDSTAEARARLHAAVVRWCPEDAEWVPLLGGLLGVGLDAEQPVGIADPVLRRRRLFQTVAALLAGAARERPLLVLLDDLQSADEGTHDLLRQLAEQCPAAPLLVLGATRSVAGDGDWEGWDEQLALDGLPDAALVEVACHAVGARRLDEPVLAWLKQRTLSNPLFTAQLARAALDVGALAVLPGRGTCVAAADLGALFAPESLQALWMARVDELPEADRRLLQVASVYGERLPLSLLGDVAIDAGNVHEGIVRLARAGLVTLEGEETVAFRHPLLRDAVYSALPTARRRPLHRRVAEALLRRAGESAAAPPVELLAYHLTAAGDPRMLRINLLAGDRARRIGDGNSALRHYAAVWQAPTRIRRGAGEAVVQALMAGGDVQHAFLSRHAESIACYRRALPLLRRIEPPQGLSPAALCYRIGRSERRLGNDAAARRWLRRSLVPAEGGDPVVRAETLLELAAIDYLRGRSSRARRLCAKALALARLADEPRVVARALDARGTIASGGGDQAAAMADLEESIAICRRIGDLAAEANAWNNLGVAQYREGRWAEAVTAYRRARDLWSRAGDWDKRVQASSNLAEVLAVRGEIDEALALFEECRAAWQRSGFALGVGHALLFTGQALARAGRHVEAIDTLEAALEHFSRLKVERWVAHAAASLAEALVDAGRAEEGVEVARRAIAAAQRTESAIYRAYAQRADGVVEAAVGGSGLGQLGSAARAFAALGMTYDRAATQLRAAEAALSHGGRPAAQVLSGLAEAAATFLRLGAEPDLERAWALAALLRERSEQPVRSPRAGAVRPASSA